MCAPARKRRTHARASCTLARMRVRARASCAPARPSSHAGPEQDRTRWAGCEEADEMGWDWIGQGWDGWDGMGWTIDRSIYSIDAWMIGRCETPTARHPIVFGLRWGSQHSADNMQRTTCDAQRTRSLQPAVDKQAAARVWRDGQKKKVRTGRACLFVLEAGAGAPPAQRSCGFSATSTASSRPARSRRSCTSGSSQRRSTRPPRMRCVPIARARQHSPFVGFWGACPAAVAG